MTRTPEEDGIIVIMPVGSDPRQAERRSAVVRGLSGARLKPLLPDYDVADPQFSLENFLAALRGARGVLADLTGERPSSYFELGVAEALGRPVVLVAETGTRIHQSSGRPTVRFYSGMDELASLIEEAFSPDRAGCARRDGS